MAKIKILEVPKMQVGGKLNFPGNASESTRIPLSNPFNIQSPEDIVNSENEYRMQIVESIKKNQGMKSTERETPYQKARARRLRTQYANTHPYAKVNPETGLLEKVDIDRDFQGVGLPNTRAARNDKALEHAFGAMDAAGLAIPLLRGVGKGASSLLRTLEKSKQSGLLSNAYKLNPWAFKPQEGMVYRGIGEAGYKDAIESGLFRSPRGLDKTYWAEANEFNYAKNHSKTIGNDLKVSRSTIAEYPKDKAVFNVEKKGKMIDALNSTDFLPIDKGRILKEHWLKGYKEIPKPTQSFKSEIDWGKWNKEIPENSQLMKEYNAIDYRKNPLSDKEKEMYKWFEEQMRFDKLPQTTNKQSIEVLDNFKQRIRTPEGQKRLKELGITEEHLLQDLKIVEDPNTYGYYKGAKNTIAMNPNHPLPKKVVRHEIEHGVQNALRQSKINKAIDGTVDNKMKALETNTTEIDDILSGLTLRREGTPNKVWSKPNINEPVDINDYKALINNKQNATDYFLTGSEGAEKSAFLGEVQQYMMDTGKIPKDSYTKITPEMVKETMIDAMFDEAGGGKYLRLFNIIKADSKNYEIISKGLNKMLSITPLIGAGAYMQNKEYKNGGAIGNNGMFDMTNPNIYKVLVPGILGAGALQQKTPEMQKGGLPKAQFGIVGPNCRGKCWSPSLKDKTGTGGGDMASVDGAPVTPQELAASGYDIYGKKVAKQRAKDLAVSGFQGVTPDIVAMAAGDSARLAAKFPNFQIYRGLVDQKRAAKASGMPINDQNKILPYADQFLDRMIDNIQIQNGKPVPMTVPEILSQFTSPENYTQSVKSNYKLQKGGLTPDKARQILHDKSVHGHPLTDKQRRFFGAMSKGSRKYAGGGLIEDYNFLFEDYDTEEQPQQVQSPEDNSKQMFPGRVQNMPVIANTSKNKAKFAYDWLKSRGLADHQAAGVVANLITESDNFADDVIGLQRKGDEGTAYGIAQWRGDRFGSLKKFAGQNQLNPAQLETQLLFLEQEAKERGNWEGLLKTKDLKDATHYFNYNYEVSADSRNPKTRYMRVKNVLDDKGNIKFNS